jgi:hypothetical protein
MKLTAFLLTVCFIVVSVTNAADPGPKKKILVVGFSDSYFSSNAIETLAKGNDTAEDEVSRLINRLILENFTEGLNAHFEYTSVEDFKAVSPQAEASFYSLLSEKKDGITSVEITAPNVAKLCEFYSADIVVFINSYELNWEEDPYLVYSHRFDSEMFVRTGKKVGEGSVSFMMDDVRLRDRFTNKLSKQLARILKQLEKVEVNVDVAVNN